MIPAAYIGPKDTTPVLEYGSEIVRTAGGEQKEKLVRIGLDALLM
jgi:hypothetical protein